MSSVSPNIAASWEVEFTKRACRKEFWAPDTRNQALLDLRTFIASAADVTVLVNRGAANFKKMLSDWLTWK